MQVIELLKRKDSINILINVENGMTQSSCARIIGVQPSRITGNIRELQSNLLIIRTKEKNSQKIYLTSKGKKVQILLLKLKQELNQ